MGTNDYWTLTALSTTTDSSTYTATTTTSIPYTWYSPDSAWFPGAGQIEIAKSDPSCKCAYCDCTNDHIYGTCDYCGAPLSGGDLG